MNPIEDRLERMRSRISLTDAEKADGRSLLASRIGVPVPSPYVHVLYRYARVALASLVLVAASGGGVAYASEQAEPGNPLYTVRLQVTEPLRLALTLDTEARADLEVRLVDRRLTEAAFASARDTLDTDTAGLIAASLDDRIDGATEQIHALDENGDEDKAYLANAELHSLLTRHGKILAKVAETDEDRARSVAAIRSHAAEGAADAATAEKDLTTVLAAAASDEHALDESLEESEATITETLDGLSEQVAESDTSLDGDDRTVLADTLDDVSRTIGSAKQERSEGDDDDALRLYSDADNRLDDLRALIEAERSLGLDLIDTETVSE